MKLMSRLNDYIIHSQFDVRTFTLLLHQDEGQRERERELPDCLAGSMVRIISAPLFIYIL